ncbi:hypothetical protein HHL16_23080 [Pseudoflavitalea sp. G-6-1-2]|uniref:hypothetical protein n=1 Tax=Pseudoflavitalea sp. G-6-1-2 TaxID=2728841 RepID=UPI00146CC913|nr:hypothetical protein [Pseudoflavitalea sp. G-6-1-2]NML23784.1 hypothetical protein [Pseudoflavitalea sp. G-6-1-2]
MKRKNFVLTAMAASLLVFASCKKDAAPPQEENSNPKPVTELTPTPGNINFTVKQKNLAVPNAKIRWYYTESGNAMKDSVVTDSNGFVNANIPVNTATRLEIISHCGIMLYERGFGPFAQGQTVDTTIAVMANTPTCETTPPDQYFIFRVNGVHYRMVTPTDNFGFWWEPMMEMGEYAFSMASDPSVTVRISTYSGGSFGNIMGITFGSADLASYPDEFSFVPTTPGYMEGKLVQQLDHLMPSELDPDTGYKIPCWFKVKRGATPPPPDPEW